MPVQFVCQQCRQRLSVSQRKRGALVNCPKCGHENRVPEETPTAAAAVAMGSQTSEASAIAQVVVFDDIPDLIAERQAAPLPPKGTKTPPVGGNAVASVSTPVPPPPPAPPVVSSAWAPAESSSAFSAAASVQTAPRAADVMSRLKNRPDDALLLVSRRAVYAMAGLLFGVGAFAFLAGYLIGRGPAGLVSGNEDDAAEAASDPVALAGSLIYSDSPGHYEPDADALVLALPVDKQPPQKLSSAGLTGADAGGAEAFAANAVQSLGGALVHANSDGEFQLVVPRSGDYYMLLVSQHVKRPADKAIDAAALNELAAYFANPSELIGSKKYVWSRRPLAGAPAPISQDFGSDGK